MTEELTIKRDKKSRKIWSHVRSKWLLETPKKTVPQEYRYNRGPYRGHSCAFD